MPRLICLPIVLLLGLLAGGCFSPAGTQRVSYAGSPGPTHAAPTRAAAPAPRPAAGLLVEQVDGLALFEDEALAATMQLAAWARQRGMTVVPVVHSQQLLNRARRGLDPAGRACGAPLGRAAARKRYQKEFHAIGSIRSYLGCYGKDRRCMLTVRVTTERDGHSKVLARYRAEFPRNVPVSEALGTAITALEPYQQTAGGGGGLGALGALSGRTKVTARPERLKVSGQGLFYGQLSKDDQRSFQKAFSFEDDSPLRACFGDSSGYAALLVAVDQQGRVTRCEALGSIGAEDTCACQVFLQHARVAAPARGRRARVFVNRRAAGVVTPSQIVVTAYNRIYNQRYKNSKGKWRSRPAVSNRAIEAYQPPPAHGLTRCFRQRKDTGWIQLTVDIPFDAKGHATKPRMFRIRKNKDTVGLTKAESACVLSYLKATRAPCPKKAGSVARLSVNIRMRKLGAPLGHRFLGGVSCRQLKKRRAKRPPQRRSRPHNRCPPSACCAGLVGFVARYASLDAGRVAVSWSRC